MPRKKAPSSPKKSAVRHRRPNPVRRGSPDPAETPDRRSPSPYPYPTELPNDTSPSLALPTADLTILASRIPAELLQQLDQAIQTGHWLFAVWRIEGGKIEMQRTAVDFPTIDLDPAVKLLGDDLQMLKTATMKQ